MSRYSEEHSHEAPARRIFDHHVSTVPPAGVLSTAEKVFLAPVGGRKRSISLPVGYRAGHGDIIEGIWRGVRRLSTAWWQEQLESLNDLDVIERAFKIARLFLLASTFQISRKSSSFANGIVG